MEQKQVTANYLVTKDDLYQFAIAAMKDQLQFKFLHRRTINRTAL